MNLSGRKIVSKVGCLSKDVFKEFSSNNNQFYFIGGSLTGCLYNSITNVKNFFPGAVCSVYLPAVYDDDFKQGWFDEMLESVNFIQSLENISSLSN